MNDEVFKAKRVTANFKQVRIYNQDDSADFAKWKNEMISKGAKVAYDRRNNIYCVAPTMDYDMYYNYVMYLNTYHQDWVNTGYFDAGMVPYLMWPSFMDASPVIEQMKKLTSTVGINIVSVPPVSLLKSSFVPTGQDYWIFRDDLYTLMTTMEYISPVYKFNVHGPEDATLSNFLKPLADMVIQARHKQGGTV
jgi:hypothetical protein